MPLAPRMSTRIAPPVVPVAFAFLRRTPRPPMPDRLEHHAARAAYWERVMRGRRATDALAMLTTAYEFALFELDGVPDTAFARQRALIARTDAEHPWAAVETLAAYVAEVEAALIPGQSPSRAASCPPTAARRDRSGGALPRPASVPLVTVMPVRILQDDSGRPVVEAS